MTHSSLRRFLTMLLLCSILLTGSGVGVPVRADRGSLPEGANVTALENGPQLRLRAGAFDPLAGEPAAPTALHSSLSQAETGLRIVQFPGPIQESWYAAMEKAGLSVVVYLPDYAYLVWGDGSAVKRLAQTAPTRWSGLYQPFYALSPALADVQGEAPVRVVVQVYDYPGADKTVETILKAGVEVLRTPQRVLVYRNLGVTVKADQLSWLAALPGVVDVEPYPVYHKLDEIQGQIMAGNLNAAGTQPAGPGYLAWLTGTVGMSTNAADYPIVDVTDDGIDNGTATPLHPDFYTFGMTQTTDRLIYNYNWTTDLSADGQAGHGNLNASIVAGYNDRTGSAYEDVNGYNYGLGINPFGRVAGSKVFCNDGNWCLENDDYTKLLSNTYALGARISTNSWGMDNWGAYAVDDQLYDTLVRDAQPGSGAYAGHQQLSVVFSAGNAGSSDNSIGSPGNAKNVITVGAAENFRPTWVDGCDVSPAGADNAMDIIDFSSRGPTDDARIKPDIVAPGTHIEGTASMATGYDGSGVCDQYMPAGQLLYAASSGTSHSAPAIAGAASLIYNYYQRNYSQGVPPSPAMLKAYLINSTRYLTGTYVNDTLPSKAQGFGEILLSAALSPLDRILVDQSTVFKATGDLYQVTGRVSDPAKPFRVTLAWTDAPGSTSGDAYVNNLDLEVEFGGRIYKGNAFAGATSMTGGAADPRNNVESVFLPAGTSGIFTIRVKATNIAGDGLPGNGDATDQDFALIATNAFRSSGVLTGKVMDSSTQAPIPNARVLAAVNVSDTMMTTSDGAGNYLFSLPPNLYALSASAYGYLPVQLSGIQVASGLTTTRDITMTTAPVYLISGVVTDSVTGDPLPATIQVTGYPFNPIHATTQTDPATGAYSITLAGGQAYTFSVSSVLHTTLVRGIGTPTGAQSENFALVATTPNGGIEGYVMDYYTGEPVPGATVTVLTGTATTDVQGYYQILGIPGGTYAVTATANLRSAGVLNGIVVRPSKITPAVNFSLTSGHLVYVPAIVVQDVPFSSVVTGTSGLVITNTGLGALDFTLLERSLGGYTPNQLAPAGNSLLVVQQSSNEDDTRAVTTALTTLGYPYNLITAAELNSYTVGSLLNYRGMIFVGDSDYNSSTSHQPILKAYLDAGGRLFLADNDEGYWDNYHNKLDFYRGYLDATYVADRPTGSSPYHLTGEGIMDGLLVASGDYSPDSYTAGTHSTVFFRYASGETGGSTVVSGTFKAVYLATDFRNLGTSTAGEMIETEVISRALTWLVGSPALDRIPWLSENPVTGTVAGGISATTGIELVWTSALSTVTLPGKYTATLELQSTDPNALSVLIPVEMNVLPRATDGKLAGTLTTTGLCDEHPAPLANETVAIVAADGYSRTVKTDGLGAYAAWLSVDHSPYTVTVAPVNHLTTTAVVTLSGNGATTTQNFTLTLQRSCVRTDAVPVSATLMPGNTAIQTFVITGGNAVPLDFSIDELPGALEPVGADSFGYTLSRMEGGYNWIDATDGTKLALGDDGEANITLPFAFSFYGVTTSTLRIGNNGAALFNSTSGEVSNMNYAMNSLSAPDLLLAPFWDDMDDPVAAGAGVYWKTIGTAPHRRVVIEWRSLPHYSGDGPVGDSTFEMILFENGNLVYQYKDVVFGNPAYDYGASASVGIRGNGALNSLPFSFETANLRNETAFCFQAPGMSPCTTGEIAWVSVTPVTGTGLINGASRLVSVTLDSAAVSGPGVYTGNLYIGHNSSVPGFMVPLTMTVLGADLTIAKRGPATAVPGEVITYSVTITNVGQVTATNTVVVDTLPMGLSSVVPTVWTVGTLAPGAGWTTSFTATVSGNAAGVTLVNAATVSAANEVNAADNSAQATTVVLGSDLVVAQTGPTAAYPGRLVTYSLVISNVGALAATNVRVTDTLPASVTSVVSTHWTVGTLAVGAVWSTTFTATVGLDVPAGTSLVNRVEATAANESHAGDNSSQLSVTVSPLRWVYLPITVKNGR